MSMPLQPLAHHFAAHHVVILTSLFALGLWVGWQAAGPLLRREQ
jgi:hypothetical protein